MSNYEKQLAKLSPEKLELLTRLLAKKRERTSQEAVLAQTTGPETFAPLSFGQERMLFIDQLEPGTPINNAIAAIRLAGPLDVSALEYALNQIVKRHEVLRSRFVVIAGQSFQVASDAQPLALDRIDFQHLPEQEQQAEVQRLARQQALISFELADPQPLRLSLLRLGEQDHVLLLVIHHIVYDGWSLGIFLRELSAIYESVITGEPPSLPELRIQYADFARWQRQWMQGRVLEDQLAYWKKQLGGELPILQLPADHPRPPVQTSDGARHTVVFDRRLSDSLVKLGQAEGVTLFMTLMAAFSTLLHRYTGQTDIIIGTPLANRMLPQTEELIGFFINTHAIRTDLSGNPSFRDLLRRVREVALEAYAHQDLPFEKLVEDLQPERDLSRHPLFQVMLAFQNTPMPALKSHGLTISLLDVDPGTAKFDLTLSVLPTDEGLVASLEYNTRLFEAETIKRMAGHLQTLLAAAFANPDLSISELPLLTPDECNKLLIEWNAARAKNPENECIHHLFEQRAEQLPDAVALVCDGKESTYAELNAHANRLAHFLRNLGIGPDARAAIFMDRSMEAVIAILGILKAGGAYIPIDPGYPAERVAFMLEDSRAPVILTQEYLIERLPGQARGAICIDRDSEEIAKYSAENPTRNLSGYNLAYVIYTSGSTGQPKGVMVQHNGLYNTVTSALRAWKVSVGDRVIQLYSFSFDASVNDIFITLLAGGSLHIATQSSRLAGPELIKFLRDQQITFAKLPPALLAVLPPDGFPKLRTIVSGGEACPLDVALDWSKQHRLFCVYGPTEATIAASWYMVERIPEGVKSTPIGRPLPNTQIYLLNPSLQPVPEAIAGEVCIGGVGLARGYSNSPDLTAEKFIPNSFSDAPGARLYRTGDLARYLPDGNIEFLGRIDKQVKIRGFRIELGEIESALAKHPSARKVVVTAYESKAAQKSLVAYVVTDRNAPATAGGLRSFLSERLPAYMIPSAFVFLEQLPLDPNGKVNLKALPAPDDLRPDLESHLVPPQTKAEKAVADIWQEILRVERVGIHDNFFDLGGHSLLMIKLHDRLHERFGKQIPLLTLFKYPTVNGLARFLTEGQDENDSNSDVEERARKQRENLSRRRHLNREA